MDRGTIAAWVATVGALLGVLAANGKGALDALAGVPALLAAWTAAMPFGVASFIAALVLSVLVFLTAIAKIKRAVDGSRAHVSAETLAFLVAIVVVIAQQWFASRAAGDLLRAGVSGAIAGLLAPYIGSMLRALFAKRPPAPPPPPAERS